MGTTHRKIIGKYLTWCLRFIFTTGLYRNMEESLLQHQTENEFEAILTRRKCEPMKTKSIEYMAVSRLIEPIHTHMYMWTKNTNLNVSVVPSLMIVTWYRSELLPASSTLRWRSFSLNWTGSASVTLGIRAPGNGWYLESPLGGKRTRFSTLVHCWPRANSKRR